MTTTTKIKTIDIIKEYLVGKKLEHTNQHGRVVTLEVENVKVSHHHRQITPDTRENDWYGESQDWDTFEIYFVDGSNREIELGTELKIIS